MKEGEILKFCTKDGLW